MANLMALTGRAEAGAKGFVAEQVVTYDLAKEYIGKGYHFCLRAITINDDLTVAGATEVNSREVYSIMSQEPGGYGLYFMPIFKVPGCINIKEHKGEIIITTKKGNKYTATMAEFNDGVEIQEKDGDRDFKLEHFSNNAIDRLALLGLPLNMTVWLDEKSVKDIPGITPEQIKKYKDAWKAKLISAGYSVGYYSGDMDDCLCASTNSGSSILEVVECGPPLNSLRTIIIGENSGSCAMRWAYLKN